MAADAVTAAAAGGVLGPWQAARPRLQPGKRQPTRAWRAGGRSGAGVQASAAPPEQLVVSAAPPSSSGSGGGGEKEDEGSLHVAVTLRGKRVAVLRASQQAALPVQEQGRPLGEYMTLPASQYSVLDAQRVERLDEDTFRCYVGGIHFLGMQVEPVITVSVTVQERGPTVRLLSAKLRGSKSIEQANERFEATMTNVVRWQEAAAGGKEIASSTSIQVALEVPGWLLLPVGVIERSGNAVMARVLATAVPRFLQQLSQDYAAWAEGDDDSRAAASGDILGPDVVSTVAAQAEEDE